MKIFSRSLRLLHIHWVLSRYQLDDLLLQHARLSPLKFLRLLTIWRFKKSTLSPGVRLRLALQELGPIFIKAGQVLSTRRDILPEDIANELEKLQDRVPPFDGMKAIQMIEAALGQTIDALFMAFDPVALASASIAQVHAATLLDGKKVVVKVLRPNIQHIIEKDLALMFSLAKLAERYLPAARAFKTKALMEEIATTLRDELDLLREGANASQLRRNFLNSSMLYVPKIHWEYCKTNVLVMERIYGLPIHDIASIKASGVNLKALAEKGLEIFFTQVFRDCFFHADMHPGNFFICTQDIHKPRFIVVDFGIMGSLNQKDQRYLAENLLAFFKRDYQRVAQLHVASGWLPANTRIDQFASAIRAVCEPIFAKPLKEISFGQLLLRLFQAARRFNINIQPQLILLQKTLLNVEGIGRELYPELDLWATATPFLEKWLQQQMGARAFIKGMQENFPYWLEKLPTLPRLVHDSLQAQRLHFEKIQHPASPEQKRSNKIAVLLLGLLLGVIGTNEWGTHSANIIFTAKNASKTSQSYLLPHGTSTPNRFDRLP